MMLAPRSPRLALRWMRLLMVALWPQLTRWQGCFSPCCKWEQQLPCRTMTTCLRSSWGAPVSRYRSRSPFPRCRTQPMVPFTRCNMCCDGSGMN
jgi:hypothetical protein